MSRAAFGDQLGVAADVGGDNRQAAGHRLKDGVRDAFGERRQHEEPEEVSGSISVRLDKVELRTALDAILTANGYSYTLRDNVIIVRKTDETAPEQLVSRVIHLSHADPFTAQRVLEARKSAKGQIVVLDKGPATGGGNDQVYQPNRLVITDYPALVDDLVALVASLDVPERVVLIEARILETTRDDQSRLGLLWPTSVGVSLTDAPKAVTSTDEDPATSEQRNPLFKDLKAGDWQWGTLNPHARSPSSQPAANGS